MPALGYKKNGRDPRHLMRFVKFQALSGSESERITAIAAAEHVSKEAVRQSVKEIERYRQQNTREEFDRNVIASLQNVMPVFEQSMVGLLTAEELVEVGDGKAGKKKIIKQPDKTTRLEASRVVKDIIVGTQPRGPMVELTNNQTTQVANLSAAETNEERMDRLRRQIAEANQLPSETRAVPDYLDRDEEPDDEEEEDEDGDEEEEDEE